MAKIKSIYLIRENGETEKIPIQSNSKGRKFHINKIQKNNEISKIKLDFYDDKTYIYDVIDYPTKMGYRRKK